MGCYSAQALLMSINLTMVINAPWDAGVPSRFTVLPGSQPQLNSNCSRNVACTRKKELTPAHLFHMEAPCYPFLNMSRSPFPMGCSRS